jgi:hypothetical protein
MTESVFDAAPKDSEIVLGDEGAIAEKLDDPRAVVIYRKGKLGLASAYLHGVSRVKREVVGLILILAYRSFRCASSAVLCSWLLPKTVSA